MENNGELLQRSRFIFYAPSGPAQECFICSFWFDEPTVRSNAHLLPPPRRPISGRITRNLNTDAELCTFLPVA